MNDEFRGWGFCFLPVIGEEVVVIQETQCSEMANISNMNWQDQL